ncbi:MAG: 2-succinyl-5-enolpyruvyl-6-hydroxy-3-cyclohexene-1-carboxylic-acid synthase [Cyanobacteria bacterium REEB65]|nr:2-succinyl-5-enolpyruvyl-6-hydroxy-3-cyclohexene-1-carboxylic-acid synthase [Cyanobacteria bacterium REEB65]
MTPSTLLSAKVESSVPQANRETPGEDGRHTSPNLNLLWARIFMEGLVAGGVEHLSLAPGSRSAPLAIAAQQVFGDRLVVHADERSAAFFALGAAKATGTPAAVLCTSGSAAGHFLPAMIEASEGRVPLIALTADRPPEVRGFAAPQAIDQVKLFGSVPRAFWDLPLPELGLLERLEHVAADACALAFGPPAGPVHVNIPLRDPLSPQAIDAEAIALVEAKHLASRQARRQGGAPLGSRPAWPARALADELGIEHAVAWLGEAQRPLMIAGPEAAQGADRLALLDFARVWGIPVLADPASGLRFGPSRGATVCSHYVAFLRAPQFADNPPDRIVSVGMAPTSGTLVRFLARHRPPALRLQPDASRRDPEGLAVLLLAGEVADTARRLSKRVGQSSAQARWREAYAEADAACAQALASHAAWPIEVAALNAAATALPPEGMLFLSSSMTIRYADSCLSASVEERRVLANRGANGIDGLTSAALGAAFAKDRPLLHVAGDMAFLHDLGGLFAARTIRKPVVLLVLNNDGGGIFAYLPIAGFPEVCDPLCMAPHGLSFEHAARLFGLSYRRCQTAEEVAAAAAEAFASQGVWVLEVPSDRQQSEAKYRDLLAEMARAATAGPGSESSVWETKGGVP